MRKKDILGNFIKRQNVAYTYSIKKLSGDINAYSALINFLPGCRELCVDIGGKPLRLAGDGYKWLMYMPMDEYWCITAFYSPEGELLEWYFDITKGSFIDESGMPCFDDLFLDLVIMPDGRMITVDADELQQALDKGEITVDDYNHAYKVYNAILASAWKNPFYLKKVFNALIEEYT